MLLRSVGTSVRSGLVLFRSWGARFCNRVCVLRFPLSSLRRCLPFLHGVFSAQRPSTPMLKFCTLHRFLWTEPACSRMATCHRLTKARPVQVDMYVRVCVRCGPSQFLSFRFVTGRRTDAAVSGLHHGRRGVAPVPRFRLYVRCVGPGQQGSWVHRNSSRCARCHS